MILVYTAVEVITDFSSGTYQPSGCNHVTNIYAINSTCYADMKYTPTYNSRRFHKKIGVTKPVSTNLHQDVMVKTDKRERVTNEYTTNIEIQVDTRTITSIFLELLTENKCRKDE